MQSSINYTIRTMTTVSALVTARKRNDIYLFIAILIVASCLTSLLIVEGLAGGPVIALGALISLIVAALVVLWPVAGFYIVALSTMLVDQSPLLTPVLTDQLYVFYWPPSLEGLIERPIGFLFIFTLLTIACRRILNRQRPLQGGKLFWPFLCYFLCALGAVVHGVINGGDFKIIVNEIRPFWYIFVSYLLAYNLVTRKKHIYLLFWFVILCAAVKALQGLYIYLIFLHGNLTGHREIMSHEESFFFVSLLVLLTLFYLHHRYLPQLRLSLLIVPCVVVALVANQRRADYIALLVALAAAWLLLFYLKPHMRKKLFALMLICVVLGVSYIAAFANSPTGIGAPAHGIVSIFWPDGGANASSNLYRTIENYDLKYTAKQDPLLGAGFGTKFLQPLHLPDISIHDKNYLYIPHNTLYWIWMRFGLIGFFALWYLLGAAIIRAGIILRSLRDPYLQLTAIYIVGMIFAELIVAYGDYQFYTYRNVIYTGLLAGILMKLPALEKNELEREASHEAPLDPSPGLARS